MSPTEFLLKISICLLLSIPVHAKEIGFFPSSTVEEHIEKLIQTHEIDSTSTTGIAGNFLMLCVLEPSRFPELSKLEKYQSAIKHSEKLEEATQKRDDQEFMALHNLIVEECNTSPLFEALVKAYLAEHPAAIHAPGFYPKFKSK